VEDPELFSIARASIGSEHGLSPEQSARLHGQTASELRDDARAMRAELGLDPAEEERPRDHGGRFARSGGIYDSSNARMNQLIRRVAYQTCRQRPPRHHSDAR
jgi:hypothetical protein